MPQVGSAYTKIMIEYPHSKQIKPIIYPINEAYSENLSGRWGGSGSVVEAAG